MSDLLKYAQQSELPPIVEIFEIDATNIGHGKFYFCDNIWVDKEVVDDDGESITRIISKPVRVGGTDYYPLPIKLGEIETGSDDAEKTAALSVSIVGYSMRGILAETNWFRGAYLKRYYIMREHTDYGDNPNASALFGKQLWFIDAHGFNAKEAVANFTLAHTIGYDRQITGQQIIGYCQFDNYRKWDGEKFIYPSDCCPYTGTKCFNKKNVATTNVNDACKRDQKACELRFGKNNIYMCGTSLSKRSG